MFKTRKGLIRIAVTGILFLLLICGCASADKLVVKASCPSVCGVKVTARATKNDLILELPGAWDPTKIVLEIGNLQKVYLGPEKTEIILGQEADLSGLITGEKIAVRNEKNYNMSSIRIEQGSKIPSLFLEVDAKTLSRARLSKNVQVTEGRVFCLEADGTVSYDGELEQLKGRGNNSFMYAKKPLQMKLREKASLGGMSKGKTWILLANWVDVSQLRNQIVLDLCREVGMKYAVKCVETDVWVNGTYYGLYLLTEKIQIGKGRVEITNLEKATEKVNSVPFDPGEMIIKKSPEYRVMRYYPAVQDPEDITGGFIMTQEKRFRMRDHMVAGFQTNDELSIRIKEPTYPSVAQTEYLYARILEMYNALQASDGINQETGKSYEEYLDATSFAQRLLIEDWTKNYDFIGGSLFMYKDSDLVDPLIYAGPSWDYDLCFGNMGNHSYQPTGKYVTATDRKYNLWRLLYSHESFRRILSEVWEKDFRPAVAVLLGEKEAGPDSIIRSMDDYKKCISPSVQMDNRRWGVSKDATGRGSGGNFNNAVEYMRKWIAKRTAWMDEEYAVKTAADGE